MRGCQYIFQKETCTRQFVFNDVDRDIKKTPEVLYPQRNMLLESPTGKPRWCVLENWEEVDKVGARLRGLDKRQDGVLCVLNIGVVRFFYFDRKGDGHNDCADGTVQTNFSPVPVSQTRQGTHCRTIKDTFLVLPLDLSNLPTSLVISSSTRVSYFRALALPMV